MGPTNLLRIRICCVVYLSSVQFNLLLLSPWNLNYYFSVCAVFLLFLSGEEESQSRFSLGCGASVHHAPPPLPIGYSPFASSIAFPFLTLTTSSV